MTERRLAVDRFAVQNGDRTLTFTGVQLGHGSSRRDQHVELPGTPCSHCRWAEISIYRTESNTYVVSGAGRSIIEGETSRCWAHVIHNANGVVTSLYLYDDDDIRYMTRVARRALEEAAENDEEVRRAFTIEEVA